MIGTRNKLVETLLGYTWLLGLAATVVFSALTADRRARQIEEYPCCCDPFGYLQMAKDIREAQRTGERPDFTIETEHTRLLIQFMQSRQVPVPLWEHLVAPLAYHYFPQTDQVGVQYPPGTGLMLAVFPQDAALHSLGRTVAVIYAVAGLGILVIAAFKRAWIPAGFFILALVVGLDILANIDIASFSINAMLVPLLLSALLIAGAFLIDGGAGRAFYMVWAMTLISGVLFGFTILVRLPLILLLPGVLLILWPPDLRSLYKSALLPFFLGLVVGGLLPLSIHQLRLTGSWYLSTYPSYDSLPPSLEHFWSNLIFYFGSGKTQPFNWSLPVVAVGLVGLLLRTGRGHVNGGRSAVLSWLTGRRVLLAAMTVWAVPTFYILTHYPNNHYYPLPATFGTVLLLGLCAFALDSRRKGSEGKGRVVGMFALALAAIPGLAAASHTAYSYIPPSSEKFAPRFEMPTELADEHSWVWADHLSGTLWYYVRKPAFKLSPTNRETRLLVYEFVRTRGDRQYIIGNDPGTQPVIDEIVSLGGRLELRGNVEGYPYYLIHWPTDGTFKTASVNP